MGRETEEGELGARFTRRKIKLIEAGKFRLMSKELLDGIPVKPHYSTLDVTGSQMPVSISCIEWVFMEIEF
jgi:hypothetical protein